MPQNDVNLAQWAMGGLMGLWTLILGWIWQRQASVEARLDQRISEGIKAVKDANAAENRDLWTAFNDEKNRAQASRERMLERLGDMPTKADLRQLKDDIEKLLHARARTE